MLKKLVLPVMTFIIATALCFSFVGSLQAALETQLLVDVSPSTDNSPYNQTQWYGFPTLASKGYCATLKPSTGDANLYLFDRDFNLRTSSKNTGLTADQVWYGNSVGGVFHLGVHGAASPSSTFTIQVTTAPYVSSITPTSGGAATLVTINGYGFGAAQGTNYVNFGSVKATSYYSWTNTQIKVYVPSGVASGTLQVVVYVASKVSNALNFTASALSSEGAMWRNDLTRTGNYPNGPAVLPLNLKWKYYTGWQAAYAPTISNNILYMALDKLYALDATTGVLKWSYPVAWGSPPAVAGGVVYFAGAATLHALDANSGSLKWKYVGDSYGSCSAPAVSNGVVYFTTGHKVYALDVNNGSLKWSYTISSNQFIFSCTIANGLVYLGDGQKIYALYANTGAVKWTYAEIIGSTPTVANGILYFGGHGAMNALDANTGVFKWKYTYGNGFTSAALSNGVLYASDLSGLTAYRFDLSKVFAFDANTGAVKWISVTGTGSTTPIISNGLVYALGGGTENRFYALDANTGSIKWSYVTGGIRAGMDMAFRVSSATISNGKVYVHTGDGYLYCFGQ